GPPAPPHTPLPAPLPPRDAQPGAVAAHGADPLGIGRASVGYLNVRLANGGIGYVHVNWLSPTKIRSVMGGGARRTAWGNHVDPQLRVAVYDRGIDVAGMGVDADPSAVQTLYRTGDIIAP